MRLLHKGIRDHFYRLLDVSFGACRCREYRTYLCMPRARNRVVFDATVTTVFAMKGMLKAGLG